MGKNRDWIPGRIGDWTPWQNNFVSITNARGTVNWDIAAGKITTLTGQQTAYKAKYDLWADESTKTSGVIKAHQVAHKLFKKQIRDFVKQHIKGNPLVTEQDLVDSGLPVPDTVKTPRQKINVVPLLTITPLGNGDVLFECRVPGDETRPSMHEHADVLEFRYKVGNPPPATVNEAPESFTKSRARFIQSVSPEEIDQTVHLFGRWKNNVDDSKSSNWSIMYTFVVR